MNKISFSYINIYNDIITFALIPMTAIESQDTHIIHMNGIQIEFIVLKTSLVKDKILCFGDFQEGHDLNKKIFEQFLYMINDYQYQIDDAISICTGDMYGESFIDKNGKRIEIRGKSGIPMYENYKMTEHMYYIFGNHDICDLKCVEVNEKNNIHLIDKKIHSLPKGTTLTGVSGIYSSKNSYPASYPHYNEETKKILADTKKLESKQVDIFVTHQAPLIHDKLMNPQPNDFQENYPDTVFKNLITSYKPQIHIFGHIHFKKAFSYFNDILYINTDQRFILLIPDNKN